MNLWLLIAGMGLITAAIKGAGPLLLGGRQLPPRVAGVVVLLPAALLAALVATSLVGEGRSWHVDAALAGTAVAGVLLWRRAHLLLALPVAVGVTALLRAFGVP